MSTVSSHRNMVPDMPFPVGHSVAYVNPRETMRLTKLALMRDEEKEVEGRRERRRSRRQSSIASSMQKRSTKHQSSKLAQELRAVDEDVIPSAMRKPAPPGILRSSLSPTSPCFPSSSTPLASSSSALESPRTFSAPLPPPQPRRRSSRVRFSEDPLPSVNSSPPPVITTEDTTEEPEETSPASPASATSNAAADRAEYLSSPLSKASSRTSLGSVSSTASDPFGVQCAYGSPSPPATSRPNSGSGDMFLPKPLPYQRLSKVLARLNTESGNLSGPSSAPTPAAEPASLPVPSADTSRGSSMSDAATLSTLESRGNSVTSGNSTVSDMTLPAPLSSASGEAYGSLLPSLNPDSPPAGEKTPKLNRQPWHEADWGLSPRSNPSPVPLHQRIVVPAPMVPDLGTRTERFDSIPPREVDLQLPDTVARTAHADSVDMLPVPQERGVSVDTADACRALGIKTVAPEVEAAVLQQAMAMKKGHQRQVSDFSVDLPFPLPPDRLGVTIGKLVTPASWRHQPLLSPAHSVNPAHALVEEYFAENESEREEDAPIRPVPSKPTSSDSTSTIRSIIRHVPSPSVQTSPCPDAYSLSAAVMQVGSPLEERPRSLISESALASPQVTPKAATNPDFGPAPESPKLGDLIESTLRARRSTVGFNFDEEESDLDTSTPLARAPLKNRIVTPNSRLLRTATAPAPATEPRAVRPRMQRLATRSAFDLKSGVGLTRGHGWSGSESEEEEWAATIRTIALRRTSKANLTNQARVRSRGMPSSKSLPSVSEMSGSNAGTHDRYSSATSSGTSELSGMTASTSSSTAMTSTEVCTPSVSLDMSPTHTTPKMRSGSYGSSSFVSANAVPGRLPWGGSSPTSPRKAVMEDPLLPAEAEAEAEVEAVLSTPKPQIRRKPSGTPMPLPTRDVEWGEPEVMIDEPSSGDESEWEVETDPDADWYWDIKTKTLSSVSSRPPVKRMKQVKTVEVVVPGEVVEAPEALAAVKEVPEQAGANPEPSALIEKVSEPITPMPEAKSTPAPSLPPSEMAVPEEVIEAPRQSELVEDAPVQVAEAAKPSELAKQQSEPVKPMPERQITPTLSSSPVMAEPVAPAPEAASSPPLRLPTEAAPGAPAVIAPTTWLASLTSMIPGPSRLPTPSKAKVFPPAIRDSVTLPSDVLGASPVARSASSAPTPASIPVPVPVSRIPSLAKKPSVASLRPDSVVVPASPVSVISKIPLSPVTPASRIPSLSTKPSLGSLKPKTGTPVAPVAPVSRIPTPSRLPIAIAASSSAASTEKLAPSPALAPKAARAGASPSPTSRIPRSPTSRLPISPIKRAVSPPPRTPSPPPDTAASFLARARENAKRVKEEEARLTPSPQPVTPPIPISPPAVEKPVEAAPESPPARQTLTPRIPLGSRLADLIAKRDAATAATAAKAALVSAEKAAAAAAAAVVIQQKQEVVVKTAPVVLTAAMKGKQRQIQPPVQRQPVCTATRFF